MKYGVQCFHVKIVLVYLHILETPLISRKKVLWSLRHHMITKWLKTSRFFGSSSSVPYNHVLQQIRGIYFHLSLLGSFNFMDVSTTSSLIFDKNFQIEIFNYLASWIKVDLRSVRIFFVKSLLTHTVEITEIYSHWKKIRQINSLIFFL